MALDRERWERIQAVFHEVVDAPAESRDELLDVSCGGDDDLREAVLQLLHEDQTADSVMDRDVRAVAEHVLAMPTVLPDGGSARFGPYRVLRELGRGGMGVVYLTRRDDLGQLAAVKVLRDMWVAGPARERLTGEQRALATLTHHSVARLYDADTLPDGTPWFAMEYVEGTSLTDYCAQKGELQERLRLFREVCEAVQHAHQYMVVHRDLKPSNILVTPAGAIKLLDFGISKQLDSLGRAPDRTRTLLRMMTPNYAAPEEFSGGEVGTHTDIYSLGVILYELLTGRRPFELADLSPREAETVLLSREPLPPSSQARSSSGAVRAAAAWPDLDVLCLTAMHKDPARRYRTVDALLRDLDHFERREPLDARPDSLRYRAGKFVRRNMRPLATAAAVVVALASVVVFYTARLDAARADAVAEAARTAQIQEFMLQLFDAGETDAAPSNDLRVLSLVDRGVQEAGSLDREPAIQAALYHTLGSLYQRLGVFDKADELLSTALQRRRSLLGPAHPDALDSAIALGLLRVDQGQLDEAERVVREAQTAAAAALPPTHQMVARATAAVGRVFEERGDYDKAIEFLDRAVRIYSAPALAQQQRELGSTLTTLANAHFYAGHLDQSEALNRRVLDLNRGLYGDRHPSVADDLLNLGAIASNRERYPEATQHYRDALDIMQAWYGDEHPQTASAMTILAQGLMLQEQFDEAAPLLNRALEIQQKIYGPSHRRVGFVLNEIGSLALRRIRYDEAEAAFRRSLDVNREVFGASHFRIGVALANLGSVHLARNDFSAAEPLFREALDVYGSSLPADHVNVAIAQIKLGRALKGQRRFVDSERALLAGEAVLLKQAVPPASWLRAAREDLALVYDALEQEAKAAAVRASLEGSAPTAKP